MIIPTIQCDSCGARTYGHHGERIHAMRRRLKRERWTSSGKRDRCPMCSLYERGKKEEQK